MAVKSRTYLKTKFESGDKPTQDDFTDLIDSTYNKLEDAIGEGEHSQSDWTEVNTQSAAYIKNKPTLGTAAGSDVEDFAPALGVNDNYVTDAQLIVINNTSGTNSGDNASNSRYENDYRAANFIADTNYLTPTTASNTYAPKAHNHLNEKIKPDVVEYQLTPSTIPTVVGSRYWDAANHTTTLISEGGTALQDGSEVRHWCVNKHSAALPNGTMVRIISHPGAPLAVSLASADSETGSYILGMTTMDLTYPNGEGFVTIIGEVNGLNTNAGNEGDPVFLGLNGAWTLTRLPAPYHSNFIGNIGRKHSSQGSIIVKTNIGFELNELHDVLITGNPANQVLKRNADNTLWENKTLTNSDVGLSNVTNKEQKTKHGVVRTSTAILSLPRNVGTDGIFTLDCLTYPFDFYFDGTKQSYTTVKTVSFLGQPAGVYFVYSDNNNNNVLSFGGFPGLTVASNIMFASVTWNGTDYGLVNDEMHPHDRSLPDHAIEHNTVGCRYGTGIDILTLGGTGIASFMTVSGGEIWDDNFKFTLPASSEYPTANSYRIFYQTSANTYGFDTTVSSRPYKADAANSFRPQYVRDDTYTLVTLNNATNRYLNYFVYATTDKHTPLYIFAETASNATLGVTGYTSITNARAIPFPNLKAFPLSKELRPIYRIIVRADGAVQPYSTSDDYRTVSSLPQAAGTSATTASIVTTTDGFGTVQNSLDSKLGKLADINTIPDITYLLLSTDLGKDVVFTSATGCAVTLPTLPSASFPEGFQCQLWNHSANAVNVGLSSQTGGQYKGVANNIAQNKSAALMVRNSLWYCAGGLS